MTESIISNRRNLFALGLAAGAVTGLGAFGPAKAAKSGISALVLVAQQKAEQASTSASSAAEKQRDLISKQKDLRSSQAQLDRLISLSNDLKELEGVLAELSVELKQAGCN